MKVKRLKIIGAFIVISLMMTSVNIWAQDATETSMEETLEMMSDDEEEDFIEKDLLSDSDIVRAMADSLETDPLAQEEMADTENLGVYQTLKKKFIEGNAGFMSLVALVLVLGLAFCIERIIYLTLSEVNSRKLLTDVEEKIENNDIEGAKDICRNTRGPVASICYQGLMRVDESLENIERSMSSSGSVQTANLEKGCSWITLFIAVAPSLGFLGTVIGMVMAFDQIQGAGDISPTIVAAGMKVALLTTIFGIIVAVVLQVFYNYILNKIERLVSQMEDASISLMDMLGKYKSKGKKA